MLSLQPLAGLELALDRERLERRLITFVKAAWPIVQPTVPFDMNWHLECICDHLEALLTLEIRDLIINIPPRYAKSSISCVMFPAWVWTKQPGLKFIAVSYSEDFALRDGIASRSLIRSDWYQQRWGNKFKILSDQDTKSRYQNDKAGFRLSAGFTGSVTGEGADVLIVDDPIKAQDAESEVMREANVRDWRESLANRSADPRTFRRVVVMQRLHMEDLTGELLKDEGWHHLCLPARWEPRVYVETGERVPQPHDDCAIHPDPRTTVGELLWQDRFNEEAETHIEEGMTAHAVRAQYQQRPIPREGQLFRAEWFPPIPADERHQGWLTVQGWDLAWSEKQRADFTACATVKYDPLTQKLDWIDVFNERIAHTPTDPRVIAIMRDFMPADVEDTAGQLSAGVKTALVAHMAMHILAHRPQVIAIEEPAFKAESIADMMQMLLEVLTNLGFIDFMILSVKPEGKKEVRAMVPAGRAAAGYFRANQKMVKWGTALAQLLAFPAKSGGHDDIVDALEIATRAALKQPKPHEYRTYDIALVG